MPHVSYLLFTLSATNVANIAVVAVTIRTLLAIVTRRRKDLEEVGTPENATTVAKSDTTRQIVQTQKSSANSRAPAVSANRSAIVPQVSISAQFCTSRLTPPRLPQQAATQVQHLQR